MKHFILFKVLITLILCIQPTIALGKSCNVVTMTGNPEYAPVTWDLNDKLVGSYIEFTKTALDRIGVASKPVVSGNWSRAQQVVKMGVVDMLIGPWFNTDRESWLTFIQPEVSLDPAAVFTRKDNMFPFENLRSLIGKQGVMQSGNSYGEPYDSMVANKVLMMFEVNSWEQAFEMVKRRRAEYLVLGLYSGQLTIARLGVGEYIGPLPVYAAEDKMYIAFSKKSPCEPLAEQLGKAVAQLKEEKLFEKLTKKYIDLYNASTQ
ncbi:substrate-binding periplasmic protein [Algicola sagamiensis]|uniref:substrate-binding periplasmic protein n=1 Tax=Algicola sagamiensis TaxID=163869 RepID=UPI00037794A0|nr:transporter substrate-binding domain-containing protein [Algicola sagamiensis]